uniref:PHD-type domain-containing protein n=1 Tax=Cuerna arida TaxID=1464854 RepID=A0A1B6FEX3_9HEMI
MSEIRHRDRILEAIDQLRKRKARPDVNRICSFMFRRFAVNCMETKLDLQKLIDAEIVIKVDYKGSTSYRNASKWAMLPSYKYKREIDTSSLISSAVAELIVLEPDYLDIGVPDFELEDHMAQKDSKRFSKKNLQNILKREVEIGTLVKLENGNYFLGEHSSSPMNASSTMDRPSASQVGSPGKQSKPNNLAARPTSRQKKIKLISKQNDSNSNDSDKMKPDDQSNTSESANVGFRVGGRQKRARIVFDPSDNNLPTRVNKKRGPGRPLGSLNKSTTANNTSVSSPAISPPSNKTPTVTPASPTPKSSVTTGTQVKAFNKTYDISSTPVNPSLCFICRSYGIRVKGVPERLISCSDCITRVHPSCLENSNDGPKRDGTWQCSSCKFCEKCDENYALGAKPLAICVVCRDGYHYQCHSPVVPERARSKLTPWHCFRCLPQEPPLVKENIKDEPPVKEKIEPPTPPKKETVSSPPPPVPEAKPRDVPANCLQDPFEDIPIDETIPDAKHWTTNQVYQYFSTHFKPDLAQVFKDQDIDGQSLLLMKRMDILTSLSLKLGPALKVYGHVRKLQTRKSHPKILWS